MPFTRVDNQATRCAPCLQKALRGRNARPRQANVIAHRLDIAPPPTKIHLPIYTEERSVGDCGLTIIGPVIGISLNTDTAVG